MGRKKSYDRAEAAESALQAFWQHGYQQTSLRDLEEATGVNRYGLYDSFTDKEGLFRECIVQYAAQAAVMLGELAALGMDGLLAMIGRFVTAADDDPACQRGCLIVSALLERGHLSAETCERLEQHTELLLSTIRGILRDSAQPRVGRPEEWELCPPECPLQEVTSASFMVRGVTPRSTCWLTLTLCRSIGYGATVGV